jgi:N-acetylmuramic acid 6-phosphate (MurNAc-6-P) etherase
LQMGNRKLRERGVGILMRVVKVSRSRAESALDKSGWNTLVALVMLRNNLSKAAAERRLAANIDLSSLMRIGEGGY